MTSASTFPSYLGCVAKALRTARRPLTMDELVVAVAKERPIGKGVENAILRSVESLYQAVPAGNNRYGWLTYLLDGSSVCHPLTGEEIAGGYLLLDELEHTVFFPCFFEQFQSDGRVVTVSLFGGPTIESTASVEQNTWSLQLGPAFIQWLDELGVENRDDIIINVIDADEGCYEVRTRLREMRQSQIVEERNIRLAMVAEEIVSECANSHAIVTTWDLAARLIGREFFKNSTPSDDLQYVLSEYSILQFVENEGYHLPIAPQHTGTNPVYSVEEARDILSDLLAEWQERESALRMLRSYRLDEEMLALDGKKLRRACDLDMAAKDCPTYQEYIVRHSYDSKNTSPLDHDQFHLLEAELNVLFQLELEYGTLLPEQQERIDRITNRLMLNSGSHESIDWGRTDDLSTDDSMNRHL